MSTSSRGPTLVATDLSEPADEALRQGDELASAAGGRLLVCHVVPDISQVRMLFPQEAGPDPETFATIETQARAAVQSRIETVLRRRLDDRDLYIEEGSPHAGIRAVADRVGAALVVVGHGGTAARVAQQASWAVLVARPSPPGGAVVGATDFSDPALPAVEAAATEAQRRGVPLRLLHAVDINLNALAAMPPPAMWNTSAELDQALTDAARTRLRNSLDRFGIKGDTVVVRGPAAANIVDAATNPPASLVVVGTRGRSGLPRFVLGSVADAVMRHAPCSVLVVPLHPHG